MKWQAASAERIGGRNEQQDSVGFFPSRDGAACLLVVADGMGGHRGGSLASQTLLEIAEENWQSCGGAPEDPKQFLEDLCQQAHSQINLRGREQDLEPHSTVVALIVQDAQSFWVHVGDSRLYHFRGQDLLGRTKDHSMVQVLVEAGEVSEGEMATHPDQNKLLRSIGGEDPPKTTHGRASLMPEDGFLLCSDGFWETITVDEMSESLGEKKLDDALDHLAGLAAERGGAKGDNVAVAATRATVVQRRSRFRKPALVGIVLALLVGVFLLILVVQEQMPGLSPEMPSQEETDVVVDTEAPVAEERDGVADEPLADDEAEANAPRQDWHGSSPTEESELSPPTEAKKDRVDPSPKEE